MLPGQAGWLGILANAPAIFPTRSRLSDTLADREATLGAPRAPSFAG